MNMPRLYPTHQRQGHGLAANSFLAAPGQASATMIPALLDYKQIFVQLLWGIAQ
jgi:hypothetical protein